MKLGRLLLRASVGGFFVGHGTQKLFGWFGGHGLKATSQAFEGMGMRPGHVHATAAGVAEAGGGAALLLGYQTPLASSALIATMLTAINRVHLKNGPWATNGGYEYNVVLIAAAAILAEVGPGELSIDAITGHERSGPLWALIALGAGAAGAAGAHALAASQTPAAETPAPAAPQTDSVSSPAPAGAPSPNESGEVAGAGAPDQPSAAAN
jgi:putative oxidoreductase